MNFNYGNVTIDGGFWKAAEILNKEVTIKSVWNRFKDTGRIDAFKFDWKEGMKNKPHFYWDSDVVKWLEGACNIISKEPDPDLQEKIDWLINRIEENQGDDGYFNIYFTVCEPQKRFTDRGMHELYCAGHLFEAAVAHFKATGSDRLINVSKKYADYIEKVFVKENSAKFITPGHQEIELALIKLFEITGEERYLKLAEFFLLNRGNNEKDEYIAGDITHAQDYSKTEELSEAIGHAVRCLYMLSGMADCGRITGNAKLIDACIRTYDDIIGSKMYITGGTGSTRFGEAFTVPYDLSNETAYCETCAAIALAMFADRMCRITKEAKYADTVEQALYNGMMPGISLDGTSFFYENPLEITLSLRDKPSVKNETEKMAIVQRKKVFDCSCCPPNLNRTLSSTEKFIYDVNGKSCYVNQFATSTFEAGDMKLVQQTDYPWSGKVEISAKGMDYVYIRIPSWCDSFDLNCDYTVENGYARCKTSEDTIVYNMDISPFLVECNHKVGANAGKTALQCGPVVYCAEGIDNNEDLNSLYITDVANAEICYDEFFRGNTITLNGLRAVSGKELYYRRKDSFEKTKIKFIPYYGFANRKKSNMKVWLNYKGGIL